MLNKNHLTFKNSILIAIFLCIASQLVIAQKKPLDLAAIRSWPQIERVKISNDGKYLIYNISSEQSGSTTIAQATDGSWKMEIKGIANAVIAEDSKHVILKRNDSIGIIGFGSSNVNFFDKMMSFKIPSAGNGEWLAYQKKDQLQSLVLLNLSNGQKKDYQHVKEYSFSADGRRLLIRQGPANDDTSPDSIFMLDMHNLTSHFIWHGNKVQNLVMDKDGSQIAFLAKRMQNEWEANELWYYKDGMDNAALLVNNSTNGMQGMTIGNGEVFFSQDGNNLFFYIDSLPKKDSETKSKGAEHVIIWGYKDDNLSERPGIRRKSFQSVMNLQFRQKVVRLEFREDDESDAKFYYKNNKTLGFSHDFGWLTEYKWRLSARPDLYVISTVDGSRRLLKRNLNSPLLGSFGFSPAGKYIFWFDRVKGHWFTYNLTSGISVNITSKIPFVLGNNDAEAPGYDPAEGIVGWLTNDNAALVYDNYDIWQIDPAGKERPLNITHGYGRLHHTRLRYLALNHDQGTPFKTGDTVMLYAFNEVSKTNGFAQMVLNRPGIFKILQMGPSRYFGVPGIGLSSDPSPFAGVKAKNANAYIFRPTQSNKYPNLCFTTDLNNFRELTYQEPQKQYNWYTTSLIHWKQPDGIKNDGLLFKPESFDPKKKYPVIFYIYEKYSDALHVFQTPALNVGPMEIAWYASHGYVVFLPDIHYKIGHPGESAYHSVISGVHYLSKLPWVDTKKLGLQGHSWGAYETNYIITRTQVFAAACAADGVSDIISEFGKIINSSSYQPFYEVGPGRIGATLWERPDLYIQESPIFKANQVITPLLILHNTLDDGVQFSQGVEWFTALRRLGKKVWMLQYTNERHNLENEDNKLDYSIRLNQFFDHYLKGASAPQWMMQTDNHSLELDTTGKQP